MRSLAIVASLAMVVVVSVGAEDDIYENSLVSRVKRQIYNQASNAYNTGSNAYNTGSSAYNQAQNAYQQAQSQYGGYGTGGYGGIGRCNPCLPSGNQWCNRDSRCNPAPGYCTVVCGMPTTSGVCDYTFRCSLVSAAEKTVAASMGVVAAVAGFMLL